MDIKKTLGVLALALVAVLSTAGITQLQYVSAQDAADQNQPPAQERQFEGRQGMPGQGEFRRGHHGRAPHGLNAEQADALKTALENKDFAAWSTIISENAPEVKGDKILEVINADNFAQFAEMHQLRQSGDTTAADAIAQELGLPERPERPEGKGGEGKGEFRPCGEKRFEHHVDHVEPEQKDEELDQ